MGLNKISWGVNREKILTKRDILQKKLQAENNTISKYFCPLIPGVCRKDCICYQPAWIGNSKVFKGFCNNKMFEPGVN